MPEPTVSAEALVWSVRHHPAGGSAAEQSDWDWCCTAVRAGDVCVVTAMKDAPTLAQLRLLCDLARSHGFKRMRFERAKGARPGWHEIDLTRER